MQKTQKIVLTALTAIGLVGLAAEGASAGSSSWQFPGVTAGYGQYGLNVTYSVDTLGFDQTSAYNNNLTPAANNIYFEAQQQCWNGAYRYGSTLEGDWYRTSTTSACTAAQGGTAAGRVNLYDF